MAALQKIRSYGPLLIIIIGLGLFAFIAEDGARAIQTITGVGKMQAGMVYGDKISAQEFQEMVEEAKQMYEMRTGQQMDNAMHDQFSDQVWQEYLTYKLVEHECNELGLKVTDEEVQHALNEGTAQSLMAMAPFVDKTGKFSFQALQEFKKQYDQMAGQQVDAQTAEQMQKIMGMWEYTYKQLKKELLINKYNTLLMQSFISNPVTAKSLFEDRTAMRNAIVAAMPNASITDKEAGAATDAELKDMYKRYKEKFWMPFETRDLKYIDVAITASKQDVQALDKEMATLYQRLAGGEDPAAVINGSKSLVHYTNLPFTKDAFPADIRMKLDSMGVGAITAPYENAGDNSKNIIKLIAKTQAPDSVLYRTIFVQGETEEKTQQRADSILGALNAGANFKALAKKYQQPGDSTWMTSKMYQGASFDEESTKYIAAINNAAVGSYTNLEMQGGRVILQILDRKAMVTKYNAAVVKYAIDFSKATRAAALNKFNQFVADNTTLEQIEKNAAKAGYVVRELKEFNNSTHNVAGVGSTKDAIRWIFDEAEVGDVSKLYECGNNNDHLLLIAVTGVHEKGYRAWDDANTKEVLTQLVMNEKKNAKLAEKYKGVKTIADAKAKGFVVDSLNNLSFANTPFVASVGTREPVLAAVGMKTKVGQTSGLVRGGAGVYLLQVVNEQKTGEKFDAKQEMQQAAQMNMQVMGQQLMQTLIKKAKVVDNRYKF